MSDAGRLRERVAFERRGQVGDGFGTPEAGDFVAQFERSARIRPHLGQAGGPAGSETVMAARLTGRQPMIVTVRFDTWTRQVTPEWRLRDTRAGTIYNIRSVANVDEKKQWLAFLCESGVAT